MRDGVLGTSQRKAAEEEPTKKLTEERAQTKRTHGSVRQDGHGPHQWKGREENPDRREIDSKLRMERNQKKNTTERQGRIHQDEEATKGKCGVWTEVQMVLHGYDVGRNERMSGNSKAVRRDARTCLDGGVE